MIYPLLRIGRVGMSLLIYPENPLAAAALTEVISTTVPLINPFRFSNNIATLLAIMYYAQFSSEIINIRINKDKYYHGIELLLIILWLNMCN